MSEPSQPNDASGWMADVGPKLMDLVEEVPPNDRIGFLFGLVIALLQAQGLSETQIRSEIDNAMAVAFGSLVLAPRSNDAPDPIH